ncbi:MAG: ATP-binding protein [Sedimentisphaerales bacterium]|nr:ATP-binding protein [Sedimentisphaerales bacterium]
MRWRPLSLAEKCRLAFGGAVLLTLLLVLVFPYLWMQKLTTKAFLDQSRQRANLLYVAHFRLGRLSQPGPPSIDEDGHPIDPMQLGVQWIRLGQDQTDPLAGLPQPDRQFINSMLERQSDEDFHRISARGLSNYTYYRVIRTTESCLSCHNPQGPGPIFSMNAPVGVAVVVSRDVAGEIRRIVLVNRLAVAIAGLLGATGAMVAFYWITQRVILRPIRQLRALANNVAEGNLNLRSSIDTGDEYQRLAEAFNHMLDTIEAAHKKLEEANRQLDQKIAELSQKNVELLKANKLKSEFLANVSHEFRTPLNSIIGFAQVLKDRPTLLETEKGRRYMDNIISSGNRLLQMINDLLQLAKAEAGKLELRIEQCSLAQICEALQYTFLPQTHQKRLKVKISLSPDIPLLWTDCGKVQQILHNLFSNAVKFTPERGQIEIRANMLDEKTLRVEVADTGPGIPEEAQAMIFEKFYQADGSLTRKTPGTGLGLAICKELVSLLAGKIGFVSQPGKGSVFWFEIPVVLGTRAAQTAS